MGVAIVLLLLLVEGCATPYQEMGFMGGVQAQRMTADTYRIVSRGNAYTDATAIQDYTILKAAETAKVAGGTHFMIISASDASRTGVITSPGQIQTSAVGGGGSYSAYTTYTPPTYHQYIKPGQDTYIRVLTVPTGKQPPAGALSVDEIIQYVGSRVKKPA